MIAALLGSALVAGAGFAVAAGVSTVAALLTVVVFVRWVQERGTEGLRDGMRETIGLIPDP